MLLTGLLFSVLYYAFFALQNQLLRESFVHNYR